MAGTRNEGVDVFCMKYLLDSKKRKHLSSEIDFDFRCAVSIPPPRLITCYTHAQRKGMMKKRIWGKEEEEEVKSLYKWDYLYCPYFHGTPQKTSA